MKVFVDSAAWIAMAKKNDINHEKASKYFKTLLAQNALLITSNYVINESANRILYDLDHSKAIKFIDLIEDARKNNFLKITWADEKLEAQAIDIFKKYGEHKISTIDIISFCICKNLDVDVVFTFDRHFNIMGINIAPY